VQNEIQMLRQLCRANPHRLGSLRVSEAGDAGASRLSVTCSVTTAVAGAEGTPSIGPVEVQVQVGFPWNYPEVPPGLLVASEDPLYLGGVDQIELAGRWIGPACLYRQYDPERHTLVQHVVSAYSILSGRTVASERDSLNGKAARYWLEHADELPLDDGLVIPPDLPPAATRSADFDLIAVEVP
jgi:hypothetical protein